MSDEMMKQILSRLDLLAAKLGVTAQYMWGVLLRQAYVTAYMDMASAVVGLLFCMAGAVSIKYALRYCLNKENQDYGDWSINGVIWLIVSSSVCCFGAVACLSAAFSAMTILLNPPYWALQQILK
jgi:hypothetical protein